MIAKIFRPHLIAIYCLLCLGSYAIYKMASKEKNAQAVLTQLPAPSEKKPAIASDQFPDSASKQQPQPALPTISDSSPIIAFHSWAETAVLSGFANVDEAQGKLLAKARGTAMKALIQSDPASALRHALPKELYAALPKSLASMIEQPVSKSGMCSMRIMCHHAEDQPHTNCEEFPVLLEDVDSWNAYYGNITWKDLLGKTVRFDGVGIEGELAVQSISPVNPP